MKKPGALSSRHVVEPEERPQGVTSNASPMLATRHLLGLGVLLLAIVPAHLAARQTDQPLGIDADAIEAAARPGLSPISLLEIEAHIKEVAARYRVSPRLVAAIIEAESEFNPRAVSRRGARGLMQLMPATASSLQVENSFDPFENIEGGVRHLRRLIDRFHGNLPLALAAYNAGEQAVLAYRGVPPFRETRRYVVRILRRIGYAGVIAMPASPRGGMAVRAPQMVSVSSGRALEIRPALLFGPAQLNDRRPRGPAPRVSAGPAREPDREPEREPARAADRKMTAQEIEGQSP